MIKTHKITFRPNRDQIAWFYQQCGYAKFAYNAALSDFKVALASDTFLSKNRLANQFNEKKKAIHWTHAQDQRAAKYAIDHLGKAVENWLAKRTKFPKFKKRGCKHSYQTDEQSVKFLGKRIKLPKIGWIRTFQELRFVGKIVSVTISRTAHRWFASVSVEVENTEVVDISTHPTIGIDVGIHTLATLDDGTKYENPKPLKRYERKLAREQRKLSRKKFLSQNWYKQKHIVERLHYRIACIRRDAHHKATTEIVSKASRIGIETLQVTNLLNNRKLAKALSDAALGGFLEKLKTKAETLGIPIVQADRFFASSKNCSNCGHKKMDLTLSERTYRCSHCGTSIDRDVNAAINLKQVAVGYTET
ncbi:IS200/IS605 family element transposase accessory protein TnpB [Candidatus Poribacteria bacterium]|nr:IS200/IS605 family element transposase accessory protein TnpB [Candidatus Poribacteria bacterium]